MFKRRLIKKIKKQLFFNFNRKNIKFTIKPIFTQNQIAKKNKDYINKLNNIEMFFNTQIMSEKPALKEGFNLKTIINRKNIIPFFANILADVQNLKDFKAKDKAIIHIINKKQEVAILFEKIKQYQKLYFSSYFFSIQLKKKK